MSKSLINKITNRILDSYALSALALVGFVLSLTALFVALGLYK